MEVMTTIRGCYHVQAAVQKQTEETLHLKSNHILLFAFARQHPSKRKPSV